MYAKDFVRTASDRAVVKASGERLLRDFTLAARFVKLYPTARLHLLEVASRTRSRTKYASLMTAYGL